MRLFKVFKIFEMWLAPPPGNLGSACGGYLVAEHLGTEGVSYEDSNPAGTCHRTLGRSEAQ